MAKNTDWSISALRFFAMVLIVVTHLCQLYSLGICWWINSAVQVFLFISGWLFGLRPDIDGAREWFGRRILRICVPFWLIAIPLLIFDVFFGSADITLPGFVLALACVRSGSIPNGAHLWYITVILLCYLVTPLLSALWRRWGFVPLVVAVVVVPLCCRCVVPQGLWAADYVVAFLIARFVRDGVPEKLALGLTSLICAGGGLLVALLGATLAVSPYTPLHLLIGPFVFSVFRLAIGMEGFKPPAALRKVLIWVDTYSYEVYLVHQIVILGDFSLALLFPYAPWAVVLGTIIWSVVGAFALHWVADKIYMLIDKLRLPMSSEPR